MKTSDSKAALNSISFSSSLSLTRKTKARLRLQRSSVKLSRQLSSAKLLLQLPATEKGKTKASKSKTKVSYHFSCEERHRATNSRNGQVKMFETIAVLIVFFFLLVVSASVYFSIKKGMVKQEAQEFIEEKNLQLTQKILTLPELDCSFATIQKENCFDLYKINAFSTILLQEKNSIDYFPILGYSEITITQVYPEKQTLHLYSNKPLTTHTILLSHYPVLLYNATANTYSFAIIEVKNYAT